MKRLTCYIALLFVFACKREITIDVQDKPSQLVVNAALDPDSFMLFNLSGTQNITDNRKIPYVADAAIEVYDKDTVMLALLTHSSNGNYGSLLKPKIGQQYYFRINTPRQSCWISERIPDSVHCSVTDTGRIIFQGKENFFQLRILLKDPAGSNYYGIKIKRLFETYQGADTVRAEEWLSLESIDFILTENPKTKFSKKNVLFTDEYFNGQDKAIRIGAAGLFLDNGQKTRSLEVYTTSYTRNGYDYYTSVNEHLFYQNDPFSQPTLLIGNVPGAFGAAIGRFNKRDVIIFK